MSLIHVCFASFILHASAVVVDSQIFLLTSEGILCVFYHKYRKAIQHEARPDQSGASIFGSRDIRFTFPDLISDLVSDWPPCFHWHWQGPYKAPSQHTCLIQSSTHPIIYSPRLGFVHFYLLSKKVENWILRMKWSAVVRSQRICIQFWRRLKQSWIYPWPSFAGERLAVLLPFAQINYLLFARHPTHQANQSS